MTNPHLRKKRKLLKKLKDKVVDTGVAAIDLVQEVLETAKEEIRGDKKESFLDKMKKNKKVKEEEQEEAKKEEE